jgi:hypothetical protein
MKQNKKDIFLNNHEILTSINNRKQNEAKRLQSTKIKVFFL